MIVQRTHRVYLVYFGGESFDLQTTPETRLFAAHRRRAAVGGKVIQKQHGYSFHCFA
jgi:hypothetical protein